MKLLLLEILTIEVTRKCNMQCKHCMRGDAQNLDIDLSYIDEIFNIKINDCVLVFDKLVFSGGEPFLNKEAIIYTIKKIIRENINVLSVQIITNASVFDDEVIEYLEKFAIYVREKFFQYLEDNKKKPVEIVISNDQYHEIKKSNINKYKNLNSDFFKIICTGNFKSEGELMLTGRVIENNLKGGFTKEEVVHPIKLTKLRPNIFALSGVLYLTSKGFLLNNPNFSFKDMDKPGFSHIKNYKSKKKI